MILGLPSFSTGFGRGGGDVLPVTLNPVTLNPVTTNLIGSYEMFQSATRNLTTNTLRDSTLGANDLLINGTNAYSFDAGGSLVLNVSQTNYNQQNWLRINDSAKRQNFNPWVPVSGTSYASRSRTYVFWAALNANPNSTTNRNKLLTIGHSNTIALKERVNLEYESGLSRFFAGWRDDVVSSWTVNDGTYRDNVMRMYTVTYDGAGNGHGQGAGGSQQVYISVNGVTTNISGSENWFSELFPSNVASSAIDGAEFMVNIDDQNGNYGLAATPMRIAAIYVYNEALSAATITNLYNQTSTLVGT